jgi:hypothetical protein
MIACPALTHFRGRHVEGHGRVVADDAPSPSAFRRQIVVRYQRSTSSPPCRPRIRFRADANATFPPMVRLTSRASIWMDPFQSASRTATLSCFIPRRPGGRNDGQTPAARDPLMHAGISAGAGEGGVCEALRAMRKTAHGEPITVNGF